MRINILLTSTVLTQVTKTTPGLLSSACFHAVFARDSGGGSRYHFRPCPTSVLCLLRWFLQQNERKLHCEAAVKNAVRQLVADEANSTTRTRQWLMSLLVSNLKKEWVDATVLAFGYELGKDQSIIGVLSHCQKKKAKNKKKETIINILL